MPLDTSRQTRIYLAIWRKAFREGELRLDLPTKNTAMSVRIAMYRALKPYKLNELLDPELSQIAERMSVVQPTGENYLMLKERTAWRASIELMEQFGLTEKDLYSPEEQLMEAGMLKELEGLITKEKSEEDSVAKYAAKSFSGPASNPFFTRD